MRTAVIPEVRFVGVSEATRQVMADIEAAAVSDAKVLITGETGVGKDVVARLIHQRSARHNGPMATINCAGMPDSLLESELFGHVRGSFTGAFRDKAGLFESADRGTAFLDEAGEMSTRMQGVLLRFLETGELQRVGAERSVRRANVRVIAATNRDLQQQMAAGVFREDLYYRLNVIRIHVPSLRERRQDILVLFEHFLGEFGRQYELRPRTLTSEAGAVLRDYRWPGNVRELKNLAEQLAVKSPGEPVRVQDLPPEYRFADDTNVAVMPRQALNLARETTGELVRRMVDGGESFWKVVHEPFMGRDMSRDQLRAVVRAGLERTSGNYRMLVELFNMMPADYKRFLAFLRKHDCHVPFHAFRAIRIRPETFETPVPPTPRESSGYAHASGM
jgi:DNA-binding NtrC family response regulator